MAQLKIGGKKYKLHLVETDDGVDVCIDDITGAPYICQITNKGTLKLYADVNKVFKRTKNGDNYIITKKEMD